MNIREVLNRPEYDFIKTNSHLGKSMIFATFGGSHAYALNTLLELVMDDKMENDKEKLLAKARELL